MNIKSFLKTLTEKVRSENANVALGANIWHVNSVLFSVVITLCYVRLSLCRCFMLLKLHNRTGWGKTPIAQYFSKEALLFSKKTMWK